MLNPASSKSGKKKPQPNDPVHPNKTDFIRAKHQGLAYVFKPAKDDLQITESDLSKQLHSSVRTPNLETSLRLLSQGADPNYFHPEKNSTPLSVAAKAGQVCQVELLLVYGADPGATDLEGKTAGEHAKVAGFHSLSTRIQTAVYELSDRLSFFLCGRRPDHVNKHYLIPEQGFNSQESAKLARRKMTGLSNKVFVSINKYILVFSFNQCTLQEELAVDVYDEVDRRETDKLWSKTESSQSSVLVPFLPVNPDYSATRNQGRQKLARLTDQEFASLVVDVLKEIKRRQVEIETARGGFPLKADVTHQHALSSMNMGGNSQSDDEPLYDSVASDDDYYVISDKEELLTGGGKGAARLKESTVLRNHIGGDNGDSRAESACSNNNTAASATLQRSKSLAAADREVQASEFSALKEQLECSEKKVQALIASNDDMRSELAKLQSTVKKLVLDNKELHRASMSPSHTSHESPQHRGYTDGIRAASPQITAGSPVRSPQSPGSRSHSMYEYRGDSRSGPTSMPGPGSSYMTVGSQGSPRNYAGSRRDSYEQAGYNVGNRFNSGYNESGTHSLPFTFHNNYSDATHYQVTK